ncbi:MAG: ABC transporter permease subunit [Akkermansia sp.]
MARKIAYLLLIFSLLATIGELCGLLLPTLSWPFTVSREMNMLNASWGTSDSATIFLPQGKFLWFGWVCVLVMMLTAIWILTREQTRFHLTPIMARRIARFKTIKRGYVSFIIMIGLILLACCDQCLVGKRALFVLYDGHVSFPALVRAPYSGATFGMKDNDAASEANYRLLKRESGKPGRPSLVIMPLVPYDPTGDSAKPATELLEYRSNGLFYQSGSNVPFSGLAGQLYDSDEALPHIRFKFRHGQREERAIGWLPDRSEVYSATYKQNKLIAEQYTGADDKEEFLKATDPQQVYVIYYHPAPPLRSGHLLGTNSQGADILAYLYGGLQVNIKAALFYLPIVYFIGVSVGMLMGYFGGAFDLTTQRIIEILSQVPFLFIIMIISDMVPLEMKGMFLIIGLLIMFGWMSMTYQLRTSTMKEKARDYVSAARVLGASTARILFVHILPNLIAILVTLIPFSVSALILALASLDYLGFGLPDTYASWGRLLNDGLSYLSSPWVVTAAFTALVCVLLLVTFIGEAVREAFDPKKFTIYQ